MAEIILLSKNIYLVTGNLPSDEKYNLISQLRRCSVSVPSNIAEGSSRKSTKEFKHFLQISIGSLYEMETQLVLARELGFIEEFHFSDLERSIVELQKMVFGFSKSLGQ